MLTYVLQCRRDLPAFQNIFYQRVLVPSRRGVQEEGFYCCDDQEADRETGLASWCRGLRLNSPQRNQEFSEVARSGTVLMKSSGQSRQ